MSKKTVLIVDDEDFVRNSLMELLEEEKYRTLTAPSAAEALKILARESVNAIVTDLRMPAADGLSLLALIRQNGIDAPVILLTGVGTVADAVAAMKAGAYDFIQKPVEPDQFILLIQRAVDHFSLASEVRYLRHAVKDLRGPMEMAGQSQALGRIRSLISQVAPSDATVLITGESGSGKELVAAQVHRESKRADEKLVRVNCAAISESLFESEFFGHRRGSFTSAISDRQGRFAEAQGGTLILDEIGTLKPEMQAKLLRVLETGEYQVVGESQSRQADVRIIAITNENLKARVDDGKFRTDLYYRLNIFPIEVPPLRHRKDDIPILAEHYLRRLRPSSEDTPAAPPPALSREAKDALTAYGWPGNVRELRNVIERAVILSSPGAPGAELFRAILAPAAAPAPAGESPGEELQLRRRVDLLERQLLQEALARSKGKKRPAAILLGIDPKNLGYYLTKHGLTTESLEGSEEVP